MAAAALRCMRRFVSTTAVAVKTAAAGEPRSDGALKGLKIAFTTPHNYAYRLAEGLKKEGARPVWCPSIAVERTGAVKQDFERVIWENDGGLNSFKGIAFTSRSGIAAFSEALRGKSVPLEKEGEEFLICSLGKDTELIKELGLFKNLEDGRLRMVVPSIASPDALIDELGEGNGQRLLCPVPLVLGLQEPPVVPLFLEGLKNKGWEVLRLNAYITRWMGEACAQPLLTAMVQDIKDRGVQTGLDALLFTSTAEVEGLMKSLKAMRLTLDDILVGGTGKRCLTVAYGPTTAQGASKLGMPIDLIGKDFNSFLNMVELLVSHFKQSPPVQHSEVDTSSAL